VSLLGNKNKMASWTSSKLVHYSVGDSRYILQRYIWKLSLLFLSAPGKKPLEAWHTHTHRKLWERGSRTDRHHWACQSPPSLQCVWVKWEDKVKQLCIQLYSQLDSRRWFRLFVWWTDEM
jgi:hypothetical protein